MTDPSGGIALLPNDDTGFQIRFFPTQEQKIGQNRMHFDLTSTSLENQQETVARSLELGARQMDVGQRRKRATWCSPDPEGNEFCVIGPGNDFLADFGPWKRCPAMVPEGRILLEQGVGLAAGLDQA